MTMSKYHHSKIKTKIRSMLAKSNNSPTKNHKNHQIKINKIYPNINQNQRKKRKKYKRKDKNHQKKHVTLS